ncbi:hypothetical protein THAOC_35975, partial [Thalassiosira oceanica]
PPVSVRSRAVVLRFFPVLVLRFRPSASSSASLCLPLIAGLGAPRGGFREVVFCAAPSFRIRGVGTASPPRAIGAIDAPKVRSLYRFRPTQVRASENRANRASKWAPSRRSKPRGHINAKKPPAGAHLRRGEGAQPRAWSRPVLVRSPDLLLSTARPYPTNGQRAFALRCQAEKVRTSREELDYGWCHSHTSLWYEKLKQISVPNQPLDSADHDRPRAVLSRFLCMPCFPLPLASTSSQTPTSCIHHGFVPPFLFVFHSPL